jgi:hypothetical protein
LRVGALGMNKENKKCGPFSFEEARIWPSGKQESNIYARCTTRHTGQQKRMEEKPASAKRHRQSANRSADKASTTATTEKDAQVVQGAEALSLAGQAPAAKVFVCGGHPSTPVPQRTQNFMSRVRQVVCSSYHAWFLLGSSPLFFSFFFLNYF